jgi:predicted  nucleic acid-binding Zn-ribbon protein
MVQPSEQGYEDREQLLQSRIEALNRACQRLVADCRERDARVAVLEEKLRSAAENARELEEWVAEVSETNSRLTREKAEIEKRLAILERDAQKGQAAEERATATQEELERLRAALASLEAGSEERINRIREGAESAVRQLREELDVVIEARDEARRNAVRFEQENLLLRDAARTAQIEAEMLRSRVEAVEAERAAFERRCEEAERRFTELQDRMTDQDERIRDLESERNVLRKSRDFLAHELEAVTGHAFAPTTEAREGRRGSAPALPGKEGALRADGTPREIPQVPPKSIVLLLDEAETAWTAARQLSRFGYRAKLLSSDEEVDDVRVCGLAVNLAVAKAWSRIRQIKARPHVERLTAAYALAPDSREGFWFGLVEFALLPMRHASSEVLRTAPGARHVIILGQQRDVAVDVAQQLGQTRIEATIVTTSETLRDAFRYTPPDVVVAHISPPCAPTLRLLAELRHREPNPPILFLLDGVPRAGEDSLLSRDVRSLLQEGNLHTESLAALLRATFTNPPVADTAGLGGGA